MTTKKHLHIFILFFFIFSLVLPKTENILLAKNITSIEITLADNINKQNKQEKQNLSRKDERKTDPWAIVATILIIVSLINPVIWLVLSPIAFFTAIYSLKRIKYNDKLKGRFWDYLAMLNFGIFLLVLIAGIIYLLD